jgi:ribosomal protein S4
MYGRALEAKQKWAYLVGGLHTSKLSRFVRICKSKTSGHLVALSDAVESRLDVLVVKTCLLPDSWRAKAFIKKGYVYVDGRCIRSPHFKVRLGSRTALKLPVHLFRLFRWKYKHKLYRKLMFWRAIPGFVFSRKTFTLIKHTKILPSMVLYPFDFNISYFFRLYPH